MNLAQISSVIFMTTISILTGERLESCNSPNICLPYYVIPVHYHIKLTHLYKENYDFYWAELNVNIKNEYDNFNFYGESSTTINILQSIQYIKLHKLNLYIIKSNITLIKNNGIIYELTNYTQTSETNLSEFYFSNVFPGLYTFKIEFFGRLTETSTKSSFKSFYTNKENGTA